MYLSAFVRLRLLDEDRTLVTVNRVPVGYVVQERGWMDSLTGYYYAETVTGEKITGDFGYGKSAANRARGALLRTLVQRGEVPEIPERPLTPAEWLRVFAARGQHGQPTTPAGYYIGEHYSSYYHAGGVFEEKAGLTFEIWQEMHRLSTRTKRFVHHCTEVAPQWEQVAEHGYADNSVEVEERDRWGNTRRRMTVAPHGDACF